MLERYLFVANPQAGPRSIKLGALIDGTVGSEIDWNLVYTERRGDAVELAASARANGYDYVVVAGGDGTVNEVGRGLLRAPLPLGILPLGSGNALARSLCIPLRIADALTHLLKATPRSIDIGRVGDNVFLSTAGIGIDAEVCHRFNRSPHRGFGPYLYSSLRTVAGFRPEVVEIEFSGKEPESVRPFLLTIANTHQYGYGVTIAPGASPSDGVLDVCIVQNLTLLRALIHARRLFTGTIDLMPGVTITRTTQLTIRCVDVGRLQVDGESVVGDVEMRVEVLPGALEVLLPAA